MQDIFYTPEHGLFLITLVNKISRIYRIIPEQIETSNPSNPIMPKKVYVPADTSIHEVESLTTNNNSTMFIAENHSGDTVKQMLNIKFYKDTI